MNSGNSSFIIKLKKKISGRHLRDFAVTQEHLTLENKGNLVIEFKTASSFATSFFTAR